MNPETALELDQVTVPSRRVQDAPSIKDVNWTVRRQEFWIVGGPQGAGKSDLIYMLAGLIQPLHGRYRLFGHDMGKRFGEESLHIRLRTGTVFDDARLFQRLSLAENVALPIRYHQNLAPEQSAGWVHALLAATELEPFAGASASAVPLAWARRAALARALALRPEIIFADNPTRGLDTRHLSWWNKFITALVQGHELMEGKPMGVILSTDEFEPWLNCGARFATVRRGEFTITGPETPVAQPQPAGKD